MNRACGTCPACGGPLALLYFVDGTLDEHLAECQACAYPANRHFVA